MKHLAAVLAVAVGCSTDVDSQFHISGHLGGVGVTHVVASTPSHLAIQKYATRVDGDGNFELALEPGHAWVVSFVDSRRVGEAMLAGSLQAGSLDALVPHGAGALELGEITLAGRRAHGTATWTEITAALGIDDVVAERLGASDDLATRYANPDVDNDGVIDALEPEGDVRLDLFGMLKVTVDGRDATPEDLVRDAMRMTGDMGVDYQQTGLIISMPKPYAAELASAQMRFEDDFYGLSLGAATPAVPAGTPIGQPELRFGTVDGYAAVGVFARGGHDLPHGAYTLTVGDRVFTFADVRPIDDALLATARGLVVPFLQIIPTVADCRTDCRIDAIRFRWMRSTLDGWVSATAAELHHAHLDIVRLHAGAKQSLGVDLPAAPAAAIAWQDMSTTDMTPAELAGVTTGELCDVSITSDDEVGMRMTSVIESPTCY